MGTELSGIQYAPDIVNNEGPAMHRKVVYFYNGTGGTLSDGDLCIIDTTVTTHGLGTAIDQSSTTADEPLTVGIIDADIPDLTWGPVVVWGIKAGVNALAGTAAGVKLQSHTIAGQVAVAAANTDRALGTSLTAEAGGTLTMFVGNL